MLPSHGRPPPEPRITVLRGLVPADTRRLGPPPAMEKVTSGRLVEKGRVGMASLPGLHHGAAPFGVRWAAVRRTRGVAVRTTVRVLGPGSVGGHGPDGTAEVPCPDRARTGPGRRRV